MNATIQELEIVTIAGSDYVVENWHGDTMLISKRGTAYIALEGTTQPVSFPGGSPLVKRGNPVRVSNVGGVVTEVK